MNIWRWPIAIAANAAADPQSQVPPAAQAWDAMNAQHLTGDWFAGRSWAQAASGPSTSPTTNQSVVDRQSAPWMDWWTKFNDPQLNSLVTRALKANHELAIATARVNEVRAAERVAKSGLHPTIDLSTAFLKNRGSAAGFGASYGLPGVDTSLYQIGFDATYEVDVFGGIHQSVEAAGALAEATVDQRRAVQVTLLGEVARNYISLRALQRATGGRTGQSPGPAKDARCRGTASEEWPGDDFRSRAGQRTTGRYRIEHSAAASRHQSNDV